MVILLDKHKKPAGFTTEKHCRKLLEKKRAIVYRYFPFTIILKDLDVREHPDTIQTYRIKIDPGSKYTGIAIVGNKDNCVYAYFELDHRGDMIRNALLARKGARRNRRSRETWYRKPKWGKDKVAADKKQEFDSARKPGWLAPSVKSIGDNIIHFVQKLKKLIPITECSFEAVRIDTQLMDNPNIEGEGYQHGTLYGYEIKEYLLDKYQHTCQYCGGVSRDPVMEWEHMYPKSRGGSDSVKNGTLACKTCNGDKDNRTPQEWLEEILAKPVKTELDEARIKCIPDAAQHKQVGGSNRYCAWVSATRKYVESALFSIFGEVECASGGKTKYNREKVLHLPKEHYYDALCVGTIPEGKYKDLTNGYFLRVQATGRGSRFRGNINSCGVIITRYKDRHKHCHGFQSGDICRADVPEERSKYSGTYTGRIAIRKSGTFSIKKLAALADKNSDRSLSKKERTAKTKAMKNDVNWKYLTRLQCADGYTYCYAKGESGEAV